MTPPRVYADFQNLDDENRLRLTCAGTRRDLDRQGIELREGMTLTLYTDDGTDEGQPDELFAEGVVHYDESEKCWVAAIDWNAIRHKSSCTNGARHTDKSPNLLDSELRRCREAVENTGKHGHRSWDLPNGMSIAKVLNTFVLFAPTRDKSITPHLKDEGFWEAWTTLGLARFLERDMCCVDVGANAGYYTGLFAAAVGPKGWVLAVEPHPDLATCLRQSVWANDWRHVKVCETAVGSSPGTAQLYPAGDFLGSSSLLRSVLDAEHRPVSDPIEVPVKTLDELLKDWPQIDLIKIDVEGKEEEVWEGMQRTLVRVPGCAVAMEYTPSRSSNPNQFLKSIESAGYYLRWIDHNGEITRVTIDQVLRDTEHDRLLWLQKGGGTNCQES